jgi:hypothetical protein
MQDELDQVTDWLLCASSHITAPYFHLPVANMGDPADRERVYCYELYHHWRNHWPDYFPFSLNGEVDKKKHPYIPNSKKPDFLVHIPSQMTNISNLLIMEVKPANTGLKPGGLKEMVDDIEKLVYFRSKLLENGNPCNYRAAYFWLYHMEIGEWPNLRAKLLQGIKKRITDFDRNLIKCFIHPAPGVRASVVSWD